MGNILGQDEKELNQSLKGQYKIQTHPYLLHRESNQLCLCHKITTNTVSNSHRIDQIIEEYSRSRCASISTLKTSHHMEKSGYCSDQQTYYLIFLGQNNYTLKEQIIKRRFYQKSFREQEIRSIIQTYLCGLRQYHQRFERDYERLGIDSMVLDQPSHRIYLRDPWLGIQPETENGNKMTLLMQSYPSPEKLNLLLSHRNSTYSQFLSNLFSVGAISLELNRLDFADSIYTKKKEINRDEIQRRIAEFRDPKLRMGIQLLLSDDPNQRKQIFTMWGIQNKQEHYLTPINQEQNMEQIHRSKDARSYQLSYQQPLQTSQPNKSSTVYHQPQIHFHRQPQRDLTLTNRAMYNTVQPSQKVPPSSHYYIKERQSPHKIELTSYAPQHMHLSTNLSNTRPKTNISFSKPSPGKIHIGGPPALVIPQGKSLQGNKIEKPKTERTYAPPSALPPPLKIDMSYHNRSMDLAIPQKKSEDHKKYLSFQDYLNQSERKPTFSNPTNFNTQNYIEKSKGIERGGTLQFSKRSPVKSQPVAGSKEKQSFSSISGNVVQNQEKKQSFQTFADSPQKPRPSPIFQIQKYIAKDDKKQQKEKETKAEPVLNSPTKSILRKQQQTAQNSAQISPVKPPLNHLSDIETELLKQEQQQRHIDKAVTPHRPPSKNKYNSTIVEVKDEDTPQNSNKSQDAGDEEYVVEEYETGSRYEGFKRRGMRNGKGRFYYQDGGYYEGNWKNNKMDGFGKLYYEGGKLAYQGMWAQDQFNGLGKVYNDNPVVLNGTFDYTNFDFLEDYWQYYEGMLSKDTKEGRGRIKLSNGQVFEGDFHEDKIQGFGKFHNLDGKTIQGMWRDSKLLKVISSS